MLNDFAVIGGDDRFLHLAKFLHMKNFKVVVCNLPGRCVNVEEVSIKQAVLTSKNLIFPIPFSRDNIFVNNQLCKIDCLLSYINKNNVVFGGGFKQNVKVELEKKAKHVFDYLHDESFVVFNASLTAQVALAQAILQSPIDLSFSKCLVLGFGRCGKMLALKIKALCRNVVVCTENEVEAAFARGMGIETLKFTELKANVYKFNFIFNTAPVRVLTGDVLKRLCDDVFVLDITTEGIDLNELAQCKIKAMVSLQMPGKFKFKSAAHQLEKLIFKMLSTIE